MAKYDDASWHYEGDYPENLEQENAATHIGMFLAWCIMNDMVSDEVKEDFVDDINNIRQRIITGSDFLIDNLDEKLVAEDLSELASRFATDYYDADTEFCEKHGNYMTDYSILFDEKARKEGSEYETLYHVENTWDNFDLVKPLIDKRFEEWKAYTNQLAD